MQRFLERIFGERGAGCGEESYWIFRGMCGKGDVRDVDREEKVIDGSG